MYIMSLFRPFYRFGLVVLWFAAISISLYAAEREVPTTYSSWLETVNAPYAWNLGFTGKNVVVGVIDDSIDMTHPFFGSNIDTSLAYNTGVVYNNEIYKQFMSNLPTQSPNDTSAVWDKANVKNPQSGLTSPSQDDHHGTCVTGCIAAYDAESNTYGPAYDA
ncbi:MAG: S8 family serine peptidase, partial [Thermoguttaceae bacterium]|nr:S8 family serine peptidase [Thermoguttaceae bacterium]